MKVLALMDFIDKAESEKKGSQVIRRQGQAFTVTAARFKELNSVKTENGLPVKLVEKVE